jgi:pyruvate formate lyase activating enzyme
MATVIATQGCDQRCPYCHNKELLTPATGEEFLLEADTRRIDIDHKILKTNYLVITGGEPTLHPALSNIIFMLRKKRGYIIKLDTNSCYTPVTSRCVDYLALDIKHYFQDYLFMNIAFAAINKIPFELRLTGYGDHQRMRSKVASILIVLKAFKQRPTFYLQKITEDGIGWQPEELDLFYDWLSPQASVERRY